MAHPDQIGPFRILQVLGQGGMGVKVLRPGIESAEIVARFDAGASEAGTPCFVMELVRGIPITEYCDSHELGTRERVALRNRDAAALKAKVR